MPTILKTPSSLETSGHHSDLKKSRKNARTAPRPRPHTDHLNRFRASGFGLATVSAHHPSLCDGGDPDAAAAAD